AEDGIRDYKVTGVQTCALPIFDELARQIAADFHGRSVTIVGVLTGCLMFLSDLVRRIDLPLRIGLIQASSYRGATTTAGALRVRSEERRVGKEVRTVLWAGHE